MIELGAMQLLAIFLALFVGAKFTLGRAQESAAEQAAGCGHLPRYPQKDPLLGLDLILAQIKAVRTHRFLEWLEQLYWSAPNGAKTFSVSVMGSRQIYTIDPTNIKALLSGQWSQFLIAPLRRTPAILPFADQGISLADGKEWEEAQALSKSFFFRDNYANTERLKPFTDTFLELLPKDGATFDIYPLVQRW
ncbi:Cytochrome P450, partial [Macrophomina phaseolina MS6]